MIDIENKCALVTGSSRGVGQQIAIGLAQRGCNIILHSRNAAGCETTKELIKEYNVQVYAVFGELSEEASVQEVIEQVNALGVDIDILYNNAAIMTEYREDIWQHTWEDWMQTMKVNVFAMYTMCGAFVPQMAARGFGRVVNLISGIHEVPELAPYGASKWAVVKMTEDMASKYKDIDLKISALDPGWLRTDMGSQEAPNAVEDVLPGALMPALLKENDPTGQQFRALEWKS